jgi:hypothetical protein
MFSISQSRWYRWSKNISNVLFYMLMSWPLSMIHPLLSYVRFFSFTFPSHIFFLLSRLSSLLSHFWLFVSDFEYERVCWNAMYAWEKALEAADIYCVVLVCLRGDVHTFFFCVWCLFVSGIKRILTVKSYKCCLYLNLDDIDEVKIFRIFYFIC